MPRTFIEQLNSLITYGCSIGLHKAETDALKKYQMSLQGFWGEKKGKLNSNRYLSYNKCPI